MKNSSNLGHLYSQLNTLLAKKEITNGIGSALLNIKEQNKTSKYSQGHRTNKSSVLIP